MGDALGNLFCAGVMLIAFGIVAGVVVKNYRPRPTRPANVAQLIKLLDLFGQLSDEDQARELAELRERVKEKL